MTNLASVLIGPLAGPECRRALGRGWLILLRVVAALAMLGVALVVLWFWWMSQAAEAGYLPFYILRWGLATVEGMLLTIALVMGPAVLAGSIAGEKQRGVMGLLLTTRVTPREIILGRLTGKLTQVGMVLLAGVPAVAGLGSLLGFGPVHLALFLALPAAVALGGGGLAVLASTVSRRGRDALLTVYLIDVLFLLSPLGVIAGWTPGAFAWIGKLNPFACLYALAWGDQVMPAVVSIGFWLAIGLLTTFLAAWRLRPASLRPLDGERVLRRGTRYGWVPAIDEKRPMLWKELFIERAAALGGLGWWIGALLVALLGGGSLLLAALVFVGDRVGVASSAAENLLGLLIGGYSADVIGMLIEWGVGLRAAVAISSERERGTWDALLTSPLEGREIVRAKLLGSLHALRWLFAAAFVAWTIAALCGAMPWHEYAQSVIGTAIVAAFMAAVGVRTSLSAATATRAMAITIGVWLVALVVDVVLAALLTGLTFLLISFTMGLATLGTSGLPRWLLSSIPYIWAVTAYGLYVVATLLLVADTRLRFDRIAGRMTSGRVATAVDRLIHGRPRDPWRSPSVPTAEPELASLNSTP
jgi:ABC-type transport system involved in multi-copper enzyme maturation permease subunit